MLLEKNALRMITIYHRKLNRIGKQWLNFSILLLFILFTFCSMKPVEMTSSTPEEQGVSSEGLIQFLDAVADNPHELHSFMMLRHGFVIAEGWWDPYRADLKHALYSTSKSFTATAVGFAVAEKKLSVDDKVISFFPDMLPDTVSAYLAELKVKHLLSMSVGHKSDPTGMVAGNNDNWVKAFLSVPIVNEPGSKFLYNSLATYMLSAIVQKVTGQRVVDYLKPRLFDPLDITGMDWETDPHGINTGGWGLRLKTEDMAKFGQLFLQKGLWQGQQILPASWVEEASTRKIEQNPDAPQSRKDSSDWLQGYCYQMWRSRHNSYRADGAYGQFILILPEQDVVIAITAETPDMQSELNLVWNYILPSIKTQALPANPDANQRLNKKSTSLALPLNTGGHSDLEAQISGKICEISSGNDGLKHLGFAFTNKIFSLTLDTDSVTHQLNFGADKWVYGETTKYGPYLVSSFKGNRAGLTPFKVAGCYKWHDTNTLVMTLRYIESPHTEYITCHFDKDSVTIEFGNSFRRPGTGQIYKGLLR